MKRHRLVFTLARDLHKHRGPAGSPRFEFEMTALPSHPPLGVLHFSLPPFLRPLRNLDIQSSSPQNIRARRMKDL